MPQKTRASSLIIFVVTLEDYSPKSSVSFTFKPKKLSARDRFLSSKRKTMAEPMRLANFYYYTVEFLLIVDETESWSLHIAIDLPCV